MYRNGASFASLDSFSLWYRSIHSYAILVVCLVAMPFIFFNIIVLTRKHMQSSTNAILTALAVSDFLIMLIHVPTSVKFQCILENSIFETTNGNLTTKCDLFWTVYDLFFIHMNQTLHSISIWLTVLLAFFRYVYICHNKIGKRLCTRAKTNIAIVLTHFFCILLCVPSYMLLKIKPIKSKMTANDILFTNGTTILPVKKLYKLTISDLNVKSNGFIFRLTFFTQAICVKLIPCILLVSLSSLLIRSIHVSIENNKRLISLRRKKRESEKSKEQRRTNIMLVLVCFLFFLTEFPQGILAIMSIIFESNDFHSNVYMKLDDIMDMSALINNAINFFVYCRMSHVFRKTFKNIFCATLNLKYKKINNMINY